MDRSPKINNRHHFLGSPAPGSAPPPIVGLPQAAAPVRGQAPDRSTVSQRPLERMLQPGAARLRQTAVTQTPSLQDAASHNDWLEWATTFG